MLVDLVILFYLLLNLFLLLFAPIALAHQIQENINSNKQRKEVEEIIKTLDNLK